MNLSMKWLSDFTNADVSPREYSEAMTMSGSKVEGYAIEGSEISNVVVGKILKIEPHPDADKLVVCKVDVGTREIQIVTGAKNVFEGALVPCALDNSTLPGGVKIKKGKLRGVISEGMMCSLGELNLTVNDFPYAIEDGIFIIEENCKPGDNICDAIGLNDTCVEFEITSNRPDCMSVIGLARETAATFKTDFIYRKPVVKGSGGDINDFLSVENQNERLCKRYIAKIVKNVKIEPSPRWMRERLRASGVRPINNFVDITNYVMLEYGQPMHAFDLKYVENGKIIIRNAEDGEKITTLDGIERTLSSEMLAICDAEKPAAVAGVMGGEYSGIMDDTVTVVFESACFDGVSVRTTAKKLGMRTEASSRFEKGLDPDNCLDAILRACELVELLGAGEVVDGIIDCQGEKSEPVRLKLEHNWINNFLGIDISRDEMVDILEKIGFVCELTEDDAYITAPAFRIDIEHKADIAEEIARFYGYNNIPTTPLTGIASAVITPRQKFERSITSAMVALGGYEVMTYSFVSPKSYDKILLPEQSPLRNSIVISNPLGEDTSIMRTTIIPSMLDVLSRNFNNRNPEAFMFELGNEYIKTGENSLPDENMKLCIGAYGRDHDFYSLKGAVQELADWLKISDTEYIPYKDDPTFHPGRCAVIVKDGIKLGILGEVHPLAADNYGIGTRVYIACLDVNSMFNAAESERSYKPLPKFPASTRDISVICDDSLPVAEIEKAVKQAVGSILEKLVLFDVYKGEQVPKGKKSVAYSIVMRSSEGTLSDEQTDAAMKRVLKQLSAINVELRS